MRPTYIQMKISLTEELSKQLIAILSARNAKEMNAAIEPNRCYWLNVFKLIEASDFSHLYHYHSFAHTSDYSFINLDSALKMIPNFSKGSTAYGAPEKQERKFKQLLLALSFLDSDLYVTLVTRRFKWHLAEKLLQKKETPDG